MALNPAGVVLITDQQNNPTQSDAIGRWFADHDVTFVAVDVSDSDARSYIMEHIGEMGIYEPPFVGINGSIFYTYPDLRALSERAAMEIFARYAPGT